MEGRKVIQINTVDLGEEAGLHLTALCDDGTIWEKSYDHKRCGYGEWSQVEPVPGSDAIKEEEG